MSGANMLLQSESEPGRDVVARQTENITTSCQMPVGAERTEDRTHTITRDGVHYAGAHLIVDMWGGQRLDDLEHIETTLRKCAEACGATLLNVQLHHFSENNGVTGVAVLAESHITLHT